MKATAQQSLPSFDFSNIDDKILQGDECTYWEAKTYNAVCKFIADGDYEAYGEVHYS